MGDGKLFGHLFLSAGAMKAGTTWLFSVLERHPELLFTPEKEIHYFYHRYVDNNLLSDKRRLEQAKKRYIDSIDPERGNVDRVRSNLHWVANYISRPVDDFWYRTLFNRSHRELYGCDFSNLYAQLPAEVWPRIEGSCDKLRVLYTLRHPVKRLWSHVKFHLQVTGELDKLQSWRPKDFKAFAKRPFIWKNAEYGVALRAMKAGLSEGTLKVIFFEDLHADKTGMLAEIEDFLGIAHHSYPPGLLNRKVNEGTSAPMPEFFPELFAEEVARINAEVEAEGLILPDSWRA